ncbi:MAG: type II toxin-antitoxin system VapC family toxin [Gammaproteobacteria bacterium]|nr:type II toxin-antitoxin system VapC family toxin [Gammaproteobacteria bacterium]
MHPPLITLELASVCLKKLRAHARQRDVLIAAFQMMTRLDIDTSPIEHTEVILLAERTGLTVYDACYLWLANELHCELLTLDKKLTAASRK